MQPDKLTLDPNDPKVIAARESEEKLFKLYGLRAKEHYVQLTTVDLKVRVLEIGDGKPLFVVPGNTGDVFPLASLLSEIKDRRIIAINRPGGGLSEGMNHNRVDIQSFAVDTLSTILKAFRLPCVDIVAHSMGAHWSLLLAMKKPEMVRSLSLLGNPGNVMQGKPPFFLRLIGKPPLNRILIKFILPKDKNNALTSLAMAGHRKEFLTTLPKELSHCYYDFTHLPHYGISLLSLLENAPLTINGNQLQAIQQPVQLLLGDHDTFASVETGKNIIAHLPHGKLQIIKSAGHLPWLEKPIECGSIILDFLSGLP